MDALDDVKAKILAVQPGHVLVIRCPPTLRHEGAVKLRAALLAFAREHLGREVPVLVMTEEFDVQKLDREQVAALLAQLKSRS